MKPLIHLLLTCWLTFAPGACAFSMQGIGGVSGVGGKAGVGGGISCSPTVCGGFTRAQTMCFNNTGSGLTTTCALGSNLTAGSFLVAYGSGPNTGTVTLSGCGLTWTQQNQLTTSPSVTIATAPNPSGSGACTVTSTSTVSGIQVIAVAEINGSVSGIIDQHNLAAAPSNPYSAGVRVSGTSITTTVANDVIIQVVYAYNIGSDVYTSVVPSAILGQITFPAVAFQWQLKTIAGSVNPQIVSSRSDSFIIGTLALEP